ncbi:MAG: hypothetical protein UZ07_CHB004001493 [Chlorobi bacterium OLB7]|nr:MAG: hypothetical protein UZ07_CHB004001493 [Chlorobi bacterium OLB7]
MAAGFFLPLALLFGEFERGGVDAVAKPCGLGAVVEDVAQVAAAARAHHFGADHAVAAVGVIGNGRRRDWLIETWPPRSGVELGRAAEQLQPAPRAPEHAGVVVIPILVAERRLGPFLPKNEILLLGQTLLPLFIASHHFLNRLGGLLGGVRLCGLARWRRDAAPLRAFGIAAPNGGEKKDREDDLGNAHHGSLVWLFGAQPRQRATA